MEVNFNHSCADGQEGNFQSELAKRFKKRMAMEVMLSRRERKAIAEDIPISQASLSDWMNTGKAAAMPTWWLPAWTREVGPGLLRWIAKEAGYGLVDEDEAGPVEVVDSAQLLSLIAQHHGRVMALIIQAREDGLIEEQEKAAIWPEICKLIRELEAEAEIFRPNSKVGRVV